MFTYLFPLCNFRPKAYFLFHSKDSFAREAEYSKTSNHLKTSQAHVGFLFPLRFQCFYFFDVLARVTVVVLYYSATQRSARSWHMCHYKYYYYKPPDDRVQLYNVIIYVYIGILHQR